MGPALALQNPAVSAVLSPVGPAAEARPFAHGSLAWHGAESLGFRREFPGVGFHADLLLQGTDCAVTAAAPISSS